MKELEEVLAKLFLEKLPPLPESAKAPIVKYLPWVIIVFSALGILSWIAVIGMFNFAVAVANAAVLGNYGQFGIVDKFMVYLLAPVVQILALIGAWQMTKHLLSGWRLVLLAQLVAFLTHLVYFSLFGIILDFAFVYLLFQIREYYTDASISG